MVHGRTRAEVPVTPCSLARGARGNESTSGRRLAPPRGRFDSAHRLPALQPSLATSEMNAHDGVPEILEKNRGDLDRRRAKKLRAAPGCLGAPSLWSAVRTDASRSLIQPFPIPSHLFPSAGAPSLPPFKCGFPRGIIPNTGLLWMRWD